MMDDPDEGEIRNESGVALCKEHWARSAERERRGELHSLKMLAVSNPQTAEEKYLAYQQRLALIGSAG
jgi:hypothetical protein